MRGEGPGVAHSPQPGAQAQPPPSDSEGGAGAASEEAAPRTVVLVQVRGEGHPDGITEIETRV